MVLFTRQLSKLIESGVNILKGLSILADLTQNNNFKLVITDVVSNIKDGKPLSESLRSHPNVFSDLYSAMVHSGEIGGTLENSLKRLADFLERQEEFKNSVRASLVYPAFVLAVGVLTVIVLLTFVTPGL